MAPLPPPWEEFLHEIDKLLSVRVDLHCVGGFVLTAMYELPLPTGDLDYIAALPHEHVPTLEAVAGRSSRLARKYHLYVQYVTVPEYPENYEARLREVFPGRFANLRLLALDAHDIVLLKLTRNSAVDDYHVRFLIEKGIVDKIVLQERYEKELRPYLSNVERHDTTLRLWLEYF